MEEEDPQINITPLIDVVFVILIGFILVAPLMEADRVELPKAGAGSIEVVAEMAGPLQIVVMKDDTIWLDRQEVAIDELREKVAALKTRYPDERPKLLQDKMAHFGTYQEVKNALADLGYEELDILLTP